MILFYPSYNRGWEIHTIESDELHFLWHSYNGYDVYNRLKRINGREYSYGELCYSDRLFTKESACYDYINKNYTSSRKYLFFN